MANIITSGKGATSSGGEGTIVKLPPPATNPAPPSTGTATASASANKTTKSATTIMSHDGVNVNANIAKRKAKMEERKRELLLEARSARIEWIHCGGAGKNGYVKSDLFGGDTANDTTNLLNQLQACSSDVLPCAPQVIESMLSSNCDWHERKEGSAFQNGSLKKSLERQSLSWESVSKKTSLNEEVKEEAAAVKNSILDLPPIPHPQYYTAFLNALCEPSAANLVMSTQKFCKTIEDAANVMVLSMNGNDSDNGSGGKGTIEKSQQQQPQQALNHGATLAKAVRGFIKKTLREMEEHESFQNYLYPQKQSQERSNQTNNDTSPTVNNNTGEDQKSTMDAAARDQLQASLEKFVYSKCGGDINMVLLTAVELEVKDSNDGASDHITSTKTMEELEVELHDKMLSLQFVTPVHLEIQCLKSKHDDTHDSIDLSYTIQQLQSIHDQSSPRQMLQSILLAHRGVTVALSEACGHTDPPGADDVLPTLILATLRAHTAHLPSALRFIEDFAPLPLLRGEAGYAYTNLCGAMQFIKELDVDGHLAEVTFLEGGVGEKSSVLLIGPEEFRMGLEECRRKMRLKADVEEQLLRKNTASGLEEHAEETALEYDRNGEECLNGENNFQIKITARNVREARSQGEIVDLDWAMKKQNESMWQQGRVTDISTPLENQTTNAAVVRERRQQQHHHLIPPEEPPLPSQFSRSYSFLTTHPDNIGLRDLPKLLKEYKMLVHATEKLLNERSVWRESERKRQLKLEREQLERDFLDAMGVDGNGNSGMGLVNGH